MHQQFNDFKVNIIRFEVLGLKPREISLSLAALLIGFLSCCMFPDALLHSHMELAIGILSVMVFGLAFVALSLPAQIEVLAARACGLARFAAAPTRPEEPGGAPASGRGRRPCRSRCPSR